MVIPPLWSLLVRTRARLEAQLAQREVRLVEGDAVLEECVPHWHERCPAAHFTTYSVQRQRRAYTGRPLVEELGGQVDDLQGVGAGILLLVGRG